MSKRWFQYQEQDGYAARVILLCRLCPFAQEKTKRGKWIDRRYRTISLRTLIEHYEDRHAANFVSLRRFSLWTSIWRIDWMRRQYPNQPLVSNIMYVSRGAVSDQITS